MTTRLLSSNYSVLGSRVGILGGTFDPVHCGHLRIAQIAAEDCKLDSVVFVPAKQNPLKAGTPSASNSDRLQMLQLALQEFSNFWIDDRELRRDPPSYTVDTIRSLKIDAPTSDLFLIVGSDTVRGLSQWRDLSEIASMSQIIPVARTGFLKKDLREVEASLSPGIVSMLSKNFIDREIIDISSTDIREAVQSKQNLSGIIPADVSNYIREKKLYA